MDSAIINYASIFGHSLFLEDQNLVLVSSETFDLYPLETRTVQTGISLFLTDKHLGVLCNRVQQASNKILLPMGGLVYSGVCKDITVILSNYNTIPYKIKAGITKLASIQLIRNGSVTKNIILEKDSNDK